MRAGVGTVGDAVPVDVEVAAELLAGLELLEAHDFAAVVPAGVVPSERRAEPLVHADVEVVQDEHRRLEPVREVERGGSKREALPRVLGEKQHVLGVAVARVSAGEDVRLLRTGRHPGRRAAALDVEDDRRDLREVGQADELLHQRDARPGGRGEGPGAVPGGADHHADCCELVLGLDDGVAVLPASRDRRGIGDSSGRRPPPARSTA